MRKPITTAIMAALVGAGGLLAPSRDLLATAGDGVVKAIVPKGVFGANAPGAELLEDYGSFALYRLDANARQSAEAASPRTEIDPEADSLLFTAHPFDTQRDTLTAPAGFALASNAPGLQLVQFTGPVKQAWLDALSAQGIAPVHYVANSGYIVWADAAALAALANLRNTTSWLQYAAPFHGFLKVDPALGDRIEANPAAADEVDVTVQVYSHPGVDATKQFVVGKGLVPAQQQGPLGPGVVDYAWSPVLKFENLPLRVRLSDIAAIAERPDVTYVGARYPRRMMDEKQDIIMSGDFVPGPASIDYLQWLLDKGFSQDPEQYPVVDLTDSPIHEGGTGVTVVNTADPMLHVGGDIANPSRVTYFANCSSQPDNTVGGVNGHGSLNGGIVAGWDQRTGSPYQDTDGHQLGLGINPFGRIGSTGIFVPGYDISHCGGNDLGVIRSNWQSGARISSNSWGLTIAPTTYDDGDQAYDVGTRDADGTESGNQEMIYVFAAANLGPSAASVSSPGAAKNIITVGASENVRPGWTDGCGIGTSGADNANDVISFSGRGPAPGQRAKPEVIGPGTHVQAGADIFSGYNSGVCDLYHPNGQTVFAASSGTSHSTPATSGIASLSWWWIVNGGAGAAAGTVDEIGGNRAPSPALMKAWMMTHPSYLTGVSANDNLPSNSQGYGMPNMSLMFDATPKVLLDQSETFDNSGETRTYTWGVADPTRPVRIALTWTDEPGALGTSPQVNNLDLSVEVEGETYLGNHFTHEYSTTGGSPDTKNNYEAVFLPAGASGNIVITVSATNIAGDGVPSSGDGTDQDFAIVCSNCAQAPSFTLSSPSDGAEVCAGTEYDAALTIGQIQGYDTSVDLAASGNPPGTTASVDPSTVTPPGTATLEVASDASVTPGDYTITVTGTSGSITKSLDFALTFFTEPAAAPALDSPGDDANSTPLRPTFTWEPAAQASSYLFELATDEAFTDVVISETVDGTTFQPADDLDTDAVYWWRVTANNTCGATASEVRSFRTAPALGECSTGTTTDVLFDDDVPSGDNQWTHDAAAGADTWEISGSRPNSLPFAWKAIDSSSISDQRLTSPVISLPDSLGGLNFQFAHWVLLEGSGGTCADGGVLEVAIDGGAFAAVPAGQFLEGGYNGTISSGTGNPLAGSAAWCGLASAYGNVIVDASPYAGHDAQFRFRLGTNNASPREGWYIDDIKVQGCGTEVIDDTIFENGFDP
jgi:hypothetical protein